MTSQDILIKARDIIADKARWIQGSYARNSRGEEVEATDPSAVCFCVVGALRRASGSVDFSPARYEALRRLRKAAEMHITTLNDTRGHVDVLRVLDRAIEAGR